MIEQTDLVVTEWIYIPPTNFSEKDVISSKVMFDVMPKRAADKKGIACRFSYKFLNGNDTILLYIAEDSYVIDLEDHVDEAEILKMVKNTYSKFNQTFDIRKLDTVLRNKALMPLNESGVDLHAIYHLLN